MTAPAPTTARDLYALTLAELTELAATTWAARKTGAPGAKRAHSLVLGALVTARKDAELKAKVAKASTSGGWGK